MKRISVQLFTEFQKSCLIYINCLFSERYNWNSVKISTEIFLTILRSELKIFFLQWWRWIESQPNIISSGLPRSRNSCLKVHVSKMWSFQQYFIFPSRPKSTWSRLRSITYKVENTALNRNFICHPMCAFLLKIPVSLSIFDSFDLAVTIVYPRWNLSLYQLSLHPIVADEKQRKRK